jgi:HCO3- transporter family
VTVIGGRKGEYVVKFDIAIRGWIVEPLAVSHWWLIPLAILPGVLGMILVALDQQITSVIVNRKEHKLKVCFCMTLDIRF